MKFLEQNRYLLLTILLACAVVSCHDEATKSSEPLLAAIRIAPREDTLAIDHSRLYWSMAQCEGSDEWSPGIPVRWYLVGDPVAVLDRSEGPTTQVDARRVGFTRLIAAAADLRDTLSIWVTLPDSFLVLDNGPAGHLGVFQGPFDTTALWFTTPDGAPGSRLILQFWFTVGRRGYAGFYIEPGAAGGHEILDLSAFGRLGRIELRLRSTYDLEVAIGSDNLNPESSRARLWLRESGLARCDGGWETVTIPLTEFLDREQDLDLHRVTVLLSVAVAAHGLPGPTTGTFWVEQAAWIRR